MFNSKIYLKIIVFFVLYYSSPVFSAPIHSPLGINTNEVMDNDASVPFVDLMKSSVPFEEAKPWLTKGQNHYDKNGWPTYIPDGGQVGTRFINDLPVGTLPNGNYTVLYEGEGVLSYGHDAKIVSQSAGKDIITIHAGDDKKLTATLLIKKTNSKNNIHNIRILMPGGICSHDPFKRVNHENQCGRGQYQSFEQHHAQILFNPAYLNYMKDFKVIRFMNMSGITRNPVSNWSQQNTLNKQTWGGKTAVRGAPLEVMVALANKIGADPWFCLPHKANDDYIRNFARYVKQYLKPNLKAYIEYTNEAWNGIFTQSQYVKQKGLAMRLDSDKGKAGYKYYSLRSVQMFTIWEQVFGGNQRLVRVMGAWTPYARLTDMLLSYRDAYKKTDVLAIGPYFYPKLTTARRAKSVNDIFTALYDKGEPYSIPNVIKLIEVQVEKAKQYGVTVVAYEGGQHLVDWENRNIKQNPTQLFIQANKSQRMKKAYYDLLAGWKKAGGTLFVNFSAPRFPAWYGSWGTKEYLTQPLHQAPKHQAILGFIQANACWWPSCAGARIARLDKPSTNPGKGVFSRVSSAKISTQANQKSALLRQAELSRKATALKRMESAHRKEMVKRAVIARKREAIIKQEKTRRRAFKVERDQRAKKQRQDLRRRRELQREREARRRR